MKNKFSSVFENHTLPWVSNYSPPVVSVRFVGHVPLCMKFSFMKFLLVRTNRGGKGSNLTPRVSLDYKISKIKCVLLQWPHTQRWSCKSQFLIVTLLLFRKICSDMNENRATSMTPLPEFWGGQGGTLDVFKTSKVRLVARNWREWSFICNYDTDVGILGKV